MHCLSVNSGPFARALCTERKEGQLFLPWVRARGRHQTRVAKATKACNVLLNPYLNEKQKTSYAQLHSIKSFTARALEGKKATCMNVLSTETTLKHLVSLVSWPQASSISRLLRPSFSVIFVSFVSSRLCVVVATYRLVFVCFHFYSIPPFTSCPSLPLLLFSPF